MNPSAAQTVVGGDGDRGVQGHYWLPAQLEPSLGIRETLFTNQQEDLIESELKSDMKNSPSRIVLYPEQALVVNLPGLLSSYLFFPSLLFLQS